MTAGIGGAGVTGFLDLLVANDGGVAKGALMAIAAELEYPAPAV